MKFLFYKKYEIESHRFNKKILPAYLPTYADAQKGDKVNGYS
jgi:hypothetical protein